MSSGDDPFAILEVARTTQVVISSGLPEHILPNRASRSRAVILTQPAATDLALEISRRLTGSGLSCEVFGLPDREEAKTLGVAASIYEALVRFGLSRYDTVVGVGGGSVTDLAGYVAGTWMRGSAGSPRICFVRAWPRPTRPVCSETGPWRHSSPPRAPGPRSPMS
jgi:3-dehydroquinate synthase